MNRIYKVVFCKATQTMVAVSEFAKGQGKNSTRVAQKSHTGGFVKTALSTAITLAVFAFTGQAFATSIVIGQTDANGATQTGTASAVDGSTAIGEKAVANSGSSLAIGKNTVAGKDAKKTGATAIGDGAKARGEKSTAIGSWGGTAFGPTEANGLKSTAIGAAAKAQTNNSVAIGAGAKVEVGEDSIAVGGNSLSKSTTGKSLTFGTGSKTYGGERNIAIGDDTAAGGTVNFQKVWKKGKFKSNHLTEGGTQKQALAIGSNAAALGDQSTAIGNDVQAMGNSSVAIGGDDIDSVAYGGTAPWGGTHEQVNRTEVAKKYRKNTGQFLIGRINAKAGDKVTGGTELDGDGDTVYRTNDTFTKLEKRNKTLADGTTRIEYKDANVDKWYYKVGNAWKNSDDDSDVINVTWKENTKANYLYPSSQSAGEASVVVGSQSVANGDLSTAIGTKSSTDGFGSVAVGVGSNASLENSVALGAGSQATDSRAGQSMAGDEADLLTGVIPFGDIPASVALDTQPQFVKDADGKTPETNPELFGFGTKATYIKRAIVHTVNTDRSQSEDDYVVYEAFAGGSKNMEAGDQVSVGSYGYERQIKNVAPGAVTPWSTDAINGSQLAVVAGGMQGQINAVKNKGQNPFTFTGNTNADEDVVVYFVETILAKKADDTEIIKIGNKWYETKEVDGKKVADYTKPVEGDDLKTLKDKTTTVEKVTTAAADGTQRTLGQKLAIIGSKKAITLAEDTTQVATAGEYSAKNIQTVVTDGQVQIQMAKKPEFDAIKVGTPATDGSIANPIVIGPVDENGTPKNRITGLDDNLPDTTTTPVAEQKPAPADLDKVKGNVATVNDILNSGWNLKQDGTAKDFVNPYDTVDFIKGAAITVTVTPSDDKKSNTIKVDVNVDDETVQIKDGKIAAKTANLTTNNGSDKTKPEGTVEVADADKKKLVNAETVANAINNAGFTIAANNVRAGVATGKKDHFVKTGEKIELIAGNHMTIQQADGKFTFETNNDAIVSSSLMGDNETTVVTAELDGDTVIKNDKGEWVKADADGNPTTEKVAPEKIKDITGTQVKAKTAKVEVDPATGKAKELSPEDAKAVATAGDVQKAINDSYWSTQAVDGVDGGEVVAKDRHNVKASHKVDFAPGKNMKLTQEWDKDTNTTKYIYATKDEVEFDKVTAKKGLTLGEGDTAINMTPDTTKALDKNGNPSDTVPAVNMGGSTFTGVASNLPKTTSEGDKPTVAQAAPNPADIEESNVATLGDVLNAGWNLSVTGNRPDGSKTQEDVDFVKPYDQVEFEAGAGLVVDKETDGKKSVIKFRRAGIDELDTAPRDTIGGNPKNNGSVIVVPSENKGNGLISANNVASAINNSGWDLQENGTHKDLVNPSNKVNFVNGDGTTVAITTDNKTSNVKVNVNVDNTTTEIKDGKIVAKTTDLTVADGKIAEPANPNSLATAGDIANAINNSFHTVTNKNTEDYITGAVDTASINPGDTITFEAGKNLVSKVNTDGTIQLSTTPTVDFDKVTVGPVNISKAGGIDAGNTQIHNVAPGTGPNDAVNVSQLKGTTQNIYNDMEGIRDDLRAGVAGAAAMGMIAQPNESGEAIIGAGIGYHRGEAALAVGMTATSDNNNWIIKGAVGVDTQKQATAGFSVNYKIW